jgi:hypothetical protein
MFKRARYASNARESRYDGAISAHLLSASGDGDSYYNTNLSVSTSNDYGITQKGAHGIAAAYTDIRSTKVLTGSTQDFMVGLVRAAITTNNIPLFIPVLKKAVSGSPVPISVSGTKIYETAIQPGLSVTWCGPVYGSDVSARQNPSNIITPALDAQLISWPQYGQLSWTSYNTYGTNLGSIINSGVISFDNDEKFNQSNTVTCLDFVERLNALFDASVCAAQIRSIEESAAGLQILQFFSPQYSVGGITYNPTVVFDFTVPDVLMGTSATKAGVLQVCKIMGFIPNTQFVIKPSPVGAPVYYSAPRNYQLGLRSTINLSTYKNCHWVPEDQNAAFPEAAEVSAGYTGTYFDCYTYQHLLNQVINPTLVRCISDQLDEDLPISEQCLNRQLEHAIYANCAANLNWSKLTAYVASTPSEIVSVIHEGFAYVAQYASGGTFISGATVTNGGSGYLTPPLVTFTGGGGSGAAGSALISGGSVVSVTITNPGKGYTSAPTIVFTSGIGGGTGAVASAAMKSIPFETPGTGTSWLNVGESIWSSWSPTSKYVIGDVVTYTPQPPLTVGYFLVFQVTSPTTIGVPPTYAGGGGWTLMYESSVTGATLQPMIPNMAYIGSVPPTITFNSSTNLFTMNVDSYGFGGSHPSNADDGYLGNNDDLSNYETTYQQTLNSSYNDQARDSYGLTGTCPHFTTPPYRVFRRAGQCFDERLVLEGDDYFHSLFGNWPALRLLYLDPRTKIQTSYVRYLPQAATAGLNVQYPLPLFTPTPVTSGYLPYGRVAGNTPYLYTFPQDYPSIGNMWQPVDAIVVTTGSVPVVDDQTRPPTILGDTLAAEQSAGSKSSVMRILAEFSMPSMFGQEYRNQIHYEPHEKDMKDMQASSDFRQFDYEVKLRMKQTQLYRDLDLPNGGNANFSYLLQRK